MSSAATTRRARIDRERYSVSHVLESAGIPLLLVLLVAYFGFVSSVSLIPRAFVTGRRGAR